MIEIYAAFWIFIGLLGSALAARLGLLAAQDRGVLLATATNGSYALIVRKMLREAGLRFITGIFAVFVGLIVFLTTPHAATLHPTGVALAFGFSLVKALHAVASYVDLVDRDKLVHHEGILRNAGS